MIEIIILIAIAFVFMGWTFAIIEKNQKTESENHKSAITAWHNTKAVVHVFFALAISYSYYKTVSLHAFLFAVLLLFEILLVFNISINLIKGNPINYVGSKGIEGYFKKIGWLYHLIALVVIIVIYIKLK